MKKTLGIALVILAGLATASSTFAAKGKPNFVGGIWADDGLYSSKFTTEIPAPTDMNLQSFDMLFKIINSNNPDGQGAVAEAAPGNPDFNGGRWFVQTAWWTDAGFAAYGTVPVITSFAQFMEEYAYGNIDFTPGSPDSAPTYFQCPLLPVKN